MKRLGEDEGAAVVGFRRWLVTKRRLIQVACLVALHSAWRGEVKWFCLPVLSCHSCTLTWFACPIGVLAHYAAYGVFPFLAVGTVLLLGALLGRLLCGWVCPFGFLQDLLYRIPSPKFLLPSWTRHLRFVVLGLMVLLLPALFGEDTVFSFCRSCPASALQVTLPNLAVGSALQPATVWKLAVLVLVLVAAVLSSRAFCRVLCPIGALLAPLNYLSFWTVRPPLDECIHCKKCDRVCPAHGRPSARLGAHLPPNRALDCIVCHACQDACPVAQESSKLRRLS